MDQCVSFDITKRGSEIPILQTERKEVEDFPSPLFYDKEAVYTGMDDRKIGFGRKAVCGFVGNLPNSGDKSPVLQKWENGRGRRGISLAVRRKKNASVG